MGHIEGSSGTKWMSNWSTPAPQISGRTRQSHCDLYADPNLLLASRRMAATVVSDAICSPSGRASERRRRLATRNSHSPWCTR